MEDVDVTLLANAAKRGIKILAGVGLVLIPTMMIGCPKYNVWQQSQAGKAELSHAEYSRQIATQEAHAKMDSAKLLAQAEVERAKGVAEANKIIGNSLQGNESYLRYLWIQSIGNGAHETVYIPTEAGLPILEAHRLHRDPAAEQK